MTKSNDSLRSSVKTVGAWDKLKDAAEMVCQKLESETASVTIFDQEALRSALSAIEAPAASSEVTEEMVELAARAYDEFAFESWQRSYDYGMGQSGNADEAKSFADWSMGKRIDEVRANSRAALTAALKGDRP